LAGKLEEPFSVESFRESITFFFQSKSGNSLTPENVATQKSVLQAATNIVASHCLRDQTTDECVAPFSLAESLGTDDTAKIVQHIQNADNTDREELKNFLSADVDFEAGAASWSKGRVRIGGPLPGYHNLTHDQEKQWEEYEMEYKLNGTMGAPTADGWVAQINDVIREAENKNPDLSIFYVGGNNLLPRMFSGLFIDVLFALAALVCVGCFMWLQLGSVFLAIAGMFEILASFMLALSTWKLLGNGSFTFMHTLVIYIVLGIGADDIFVFADAWKQSRAQGPSISGSIAARLQWTMNRSFKAMLITSATTCSAFMLTSLTDLPIISTFGSFASVVIVCNFLLVVSWYPACAVFHERYFVRSCGGFCAVRVCGFMCKGCGGQWGLGTNNSSVDVEAGDEVCAQGPVGYDRDKLRLAERFFDGPFFRGMQKRWVRVAILICFSVVGLTGVIFAGTSVRLTDKAWTETILVDGHPLQTTLNLWLGTNDVFAATDDDFKEAGTWMFGLDPRRPVDRTGTDPLGQDVLANYGEPVFTGADLGTPEAQEMLVAACDRLHTIESLAIDPDTGKPELYCFMSDFKAYRISHNLSFPVASSALVPALESWRHDFECTRQGCYKNVQETGVAQGTRYPNFYEERTGYYVEDGTVIFAYISGNLTMDARESDLGRIVPEYEEWRDAAKLFAEEEGVDVIGFTGRLEWIAIMQALIKGVTTGVPASLCIAMLVLVLSTANLYIAGIATLSILGVMASFFITFVASGWVLGMYECMFLQLTAGMAVDYVVHLAHAYNESHATSRADRMRESLREMGVSVGSGAISTLAASGLLFICSFRVFNLYGSFIFFVILWAIVWALLFFPAAMMAFGPEGTQGNLAFLKRAYAFGRRSPRGRCLFSSRTSA